MPHLARHSLYIALICSIISLSSCTSPDPKQALRQSLTELITAIEQKKQRDVSEKLSQSFRGNGRLDQRTMTALVFRYYLRYKFIRIYSFIDSIEISEGKARMVFHAALSSSKNILPENMRTYRVNASWVLLDGQWKIAKADWIEVQAQTVLPLLKESFP